MYSNDDNAAENKNENMADPRWTTLEQHVNAGLMVYWKLTTSAEKHDMEDEKKTFCIGGARMA